MGRQLTPNEIALNLALTGQTITHLPNDATTVKPVGIKLQMHTPLQWDSSAAPTAWGPSVLTLTLEDPNTNLLYVADACVDRTGFYNVWKLTAQEAKQVQDCESLGAQRGEKIVKIIESCWGRTADFYTNIPA